MRGWSIVIGLLSIGGLWASNTAAMQNKADKRDLDTLAASTIQTVNKMQGDISVLKYLACKEHPNDSVCSIK